MITVRIIQLALLRAFTQLLLMNHVPIVTVPLKLIEVLICVCSVASGAVLL